MDSCSLRCEDAANAGGSFTPSRANAHTRSASSAGGTDGEAKRVAALLPSSEARAGGGGEARVESAVSRRETCPASRTWTLEGAK